MPPLGSNAIGANDLLPDFVGIFIRIPKQKKVLLTSSVCWEWSKMTNCCGSRLRKGEVFAYVGRNQNLKDLKMTLGAGSAPEEGTEGPHFFDSRQKRSSQ
jgi:hypothetical protein